MSTTTFMSNWITNIGMCMTSITVTRTVLTIRPANLMHTAIATRRCGTAIRISPTYIIGTTIRISLCRRDDGPKTQTGE